MIKITDPLDESQAFDYDESGLLREREDARGNIWSFEYSTEGDLIEATDPLGNSAQFEYDEDDGLLLEAEDPNGHTSYFEYDDRGNLTSSTDPLGHETQFGYNSRNFLISVQEPGKLEADLTRDALGNVLSSVSPLGHTTAYEYNANGARTKTIDPAGKEWLVERNKMDRPTAYVDPDGERRELYYDGNMRVWKVIDRRGKVHTTVFDDDGRALGTHSPRGAEWDYGYDARGNLIWATDPLGHHTTYGYSDRDELIAVEEPLGIESSYDYDSGGLLESVTTAGTETSFEYDDAGQLTGIDEPLGKTTTFDYDDAGNLASRNDGESVLDYSYDAADRLQEITEGSSVLRAFDYDSADRLVGATDAQSDTIELGYDDEDNLIAADDGRGRDSEMTYNSRGLLTELTDDRGTVSYSYDFLGRVETMTDPQSGVSTFGYDASSNLVSTELPNGVVTESTFNSDGQLSSMTSTAGSTVLQSRDYTYDLAGNRTSEIDESSLVTGYAYDNLDRLVEFDPPGSGSVAYGYDDHGNRIGAGSVSFDFNDLNQLTSDSVGNDYIYDDAGRLVEQSDGTTTKTWDWDALDQLSVLDDGTSDAAFTYDALGRLASRTASSSTEATHYSDLSDVATLDTGSGGMLRRYVDSPAGLVEQRGASATTYLLADGRGDITALTDGTGSVTARQSFDPWGQQMSGTARSFGFLGAFGKRTDTALGSVQMGARSYDSALGTFVSADSVLGAPGLSATANRYEYAAENPLAVYDLDGNAPSVTSPLAGGAGASISGSVSESSAYAQGIAATSPQMKPDSGQCGGDDHAGIFESAWNGLRRTGDKVAGYWADKAIDPDSGGFTQGLANAVGPVWSLVDCETAGTTALTLAALAAGGGASAWLARGAGEAAVAGAGGEAAAGAGGEAAVTGTRFVTTPRGTTFEIPKGWTSREADNGRGIVFQRPGAQGNADSLRIMEPTDQYPGGYFRYYNEHGQPLDVQGKPGPPSATHHEETYTGPLEGWPH